MSEVKTPLEEQLEAAYKQGVFDHNIYGHELDIEWSCKDAIALIIENIPTAKAGQQANKPEHGVKWQRCYDGAPGITKWYTIRNWITGKDAASVYCDNANSILNYCKEKGFDYPEFEWLDEYASHPEQIIVVNEKMYIALKILKGYFGENDKTVMQHVLFTTADDAIKAYENLGDSNHKTNEGGLTIEDYKEVIKSHNALVRELDVFINGKNAARQASLCDVVSQVVKCGIKINDKPGWQNTKPEFNKECFLMTETLYGTNKEYRTWWIKKLCTPVDEQWYWGWLELDGEEYGDIADLKADRYLVIELPGTK